MFRHPKYYKNLRKLARNSELHVRPQGSEACDTDQAISKEQPDGVHTSFRPGPGLKRQAASRKPQAPSDKPQAPSSKLQA